MNAILFIFLFNVLVRKLVNSSLLIIDSLKSLSLGQVRQLLLHEVIKNGYLSNLIESKVYKNKEESINSEKELKKTIVFVEENENWKELKLNEEILTILKEIQLLFHSNIHKQIGYPLMIYHICAIFLYCGKSCNVQLNKDQIHFNYHKWKWLDCFLQEAINILSLHERKKNLMNICIVD